MRELEGLSYREIGERMELTPAAVESTLFRARRKLEHEYAAARHRPPLPGSSAPPSAGWPRAWSPIATAAGSTATPGAARAAAAGPRQLGVEPMLARRTIAARAAALLPLPAFLRRRSLDGFGDVPSAGAGAGAGAHGVAAPLIAVGPVSVETAARWAARPPR